ncbi:hypothetical protein SMSP2_00470 [Limihaloglobus sulfuriphilus]|uniref:DUF1015 domain-containing protein n=1 Tax=Limihaloglobus sulfuriphilus TaxID=1851148 RepID=A0A1Q2MBU0_9BACT|nr:DUF1015 domain-containing protein [Limihaloglobus sulfuriphilus]AQQ70129.1 hypothetical protein SMSP2_00470 [Limihaloglobus sulfuriphilus]
MEIKSFKGYRFSNDVVGNSADCIAPPYDVINDEQQEKLYQQNEYNIVRVTKGKTAEFDEEGNNVYSRASDYFESWIESGALKQDPENSIYAYVQSFEAQDKSYTRSGFIALGKLAQFGKGVRPHEKTLDGPKADRLNLMRATQAQFGQIFMLYDDPECIADAIIAEAAKNQPLLSFVDDENVTHSLYAITGEANITDIAAMMADKDAVIADGHHRYETALNYFNETGKPEAAFRMMTFVNMHNEGLVILPTHRLVGNLADFDPKELKTKLSGDFDVTVYGKDKNTDKDQMFADLKKDFDQAGISFGIYDNSGTFSRAVLKDIKSIQQVADGLSEASQKLDVTVLHRLILEGILGINEQALASESNLEYIKDIGDAIDRSVALVDSGEKQAVFFMNPTRIEQVQGVAAAGEKMPQKSTFFYPKIFTGLVINKL